MDGINEKLNKGFGEKSEYTAESIASGFQLHKIKSNN